MTEQKKIGLALGSGAARGWAHIGVIQELEAMGVPIHAVAGCSIGALVGGVYALGQIKTLERWSRSLTLRHTALLLMDPHWGTGGLVRGERVFRILKAFGFDGQIEELKIPFAAVATDLQNGDEIWLRHGSLLEAVRCSAAIPGIVKPHYYQSKWLLDGALVNPVPVSLARSLGCEFVIAVNLNDDLLHPSERPIPKMSSLHQLLEMTWNWLPIQLRQFSLKNISSWIPVMGTSPIDMPAQSPASDPESPLETPIEPINPEIELPFEAQSENWLTQPNYRQVIWSMMTIMGDRITRYRMRLDQPDVEIIPRLAHLSFLEFHTAQESIEEGREAVRRSAEAIKALLIRAGYAPANNPAETNESKTQTPETQPPETQNKETRL